jgi:hypothetical protein
MRRSGRATSAARLGKAIDAVRDRHRIDEMLLEARFQRRLDLLDPFHRRLDLAAVDRG